MAKKHIASYPECPKYQEKIILGAWFFDTVLPWVERGVLEERFRGFCSVDSGGKMVYCGYDYCSENRRLTA